VAAAAALLCGTVPAANSDMPGRRRKARELALQFLYQLEQNGATDPRPFEADFWARHPVDDEARAFADSLVQGAKRQQGDIDKRIAECAEHWDLDRMAVVDRNILRLAVYELLFEPGVPGKVTINEAIEIAKKFGTAESSRFINGVLDRIHRELRPAS
jgi:N utilization substance protein B